MKLLFLIGNSAVGKMTVGQALAKITDFRLFHNHMTIEPVLDIFGTFHIPAILKMRDVVFEEFATTDHYGLIHTIMWAFDSQEDWDYVAHCAEIFQRHGGEIYYVELVAPQEIRLQRNSTENRLKHKASKRNLETSAARLLSDDANHRLESYDGEIPFPNYIKIDNSNLSPQAVAKMIQERFHFIPTAIKSEQ